MKTETRSQIVKIIEQNGPIRPSELVQLLNISPQAVHRHLRALVSAGVIESKGRPPSTCYVIAGIPDFSRALKWFQSNSTVGSTSEVCETRDVFTGRLSHLVPFKKQGLSKEDLPLVISMSGEIGNNSFDHNLGQWRDVPGCWFEIQATLHRLWILIADRGQGIYRTLSRVEPDIPNEQAAVEMAFSKHISGRAPEKRGNGLKYVTGIIMEKTKSGISCRSGAGLVHYGEWGKDCSNVLRSLSERNSGTVTLIAWVLQ